MLALHEFDVYGLEIPARGAEGAEAYARAELEHSQNYHSGPTSNGYTKSSRDSPGRVEIITANLFGRDCYIRFHLWLYHKFYDGAPGRRVLESPCGRRRRDGRQPGVG